MKTITEIYREYKIFAGLQKHMLSVAAVAKIICEHSKIELKTDHLISACLLHDMGNIIKSDLPRFPQFLEPEGLEYWQGVQYLFFEKYGRDEDEATLAIAREIGVSDMTLRIIDSISFSLIEETCTVGDLANKICNYSDMRVGPNGILSLDARLDECAGRLRARGLLLRVKEVEASRPIRQALETEIFGTTDITPAFITDETIAPVIEELRNWQIV
jgi:hypothetical protein